MSHQPSSTSKYISVTLVFLISSFLTVHTTDAKSDQLSSSQNDVEYPIKGNDVLVRKRRDYAAEGDEADGEREDYKDDVYDGDVADEVVPDHDPYPLQGTNLGGNKKAAAKGGAKPAKTAVKPKIAEEGAEDKKENKEDEDDVLPVLLKNFEKKYKSNSKNPTINLFFSI